MSARLLESLVAADRVDALDGAVLAACPIAVAPLRGDLAPLSEPGRRFLLAADGVYLEARSQVLYARIQVARAALPFGPADFALEVIGGPIALIVLDEIIEAAIGAHPQEMARLVVRDADGTDTLVTPQQVGNGASVHYDDRAVDESRLLIDAHSHGLHAARFSTTDDASDRSRMGPHVSLVVGHCGNRFTSEVAARLCIGKYLVPISFTRIKDFFA